jgi:dihydrofolate reductase
MIKIIAAMTPSRVIGNRGVLPWSKKDVPGELKWFAEATMGHIVVMGRKTWDSFPLAFKPLPNRENIVVSRNANQSKYPGAIVVKSLSGALGHPLDGHDVWIIGGAEIYTEALSFADELYLTIIDKEFEGDTYFPEFENMFTFAEDVKRGEGWTVKRFTKIHV